MTEVHLVFYGSCLDSSPVLRKMKWLLPEFNLSIPYKLQPGVTESLESNSRDILLDVSSHGHQGF